MKSTYALAAFISGVVAAKTPAYVGFPKSLVCQNQDLTTFTVPQIDVLAAVTNGAIKANLIDIFGAGDTATAHCSGVTAPLYAVAFDKIDVGFAYDKATDTFTFCYSEEPLTNSFGYPDGCAEVN